MNLEDLNCQFWAENLMDITKALAEKSDHNEFPPKLFVFPEDSNEEVLVANIELVAGWAYSMVQQAVIQSGIKAKAIALVSDAYIDDGLKVSANEPDYKKILDRPHIPLAKRFEDGDPDVTEAFTVQVLASGSSATTIQRYSYDNEYHWKDSETINGSDSSSVAYGWDFDRLISGKPRLDHRDRPICPRCNGYIPNDAQPGAYPGAISRTDNLTEICSSCGTEEAMMDFASRLAK